MQHPASATTGGDFEALAIAGNGDLFGILERGGGMDCELYAVADDGVVTLLGAVTGFETVRGLAFQGATLYGTDTSGDQLLSIDSTTGAPTVIGAAGASVTALTWIP